MKKILSLAVLAVSLFNLSALAEDVNNIVTYPYKTYALPGELDKVLFFNSNSPEMVTNEGILLSTFSPDGKTQPEAHLNRTFQGRFDIFTHHITPKTNTRKLYQGILMKNTSDKTVTVKVLKSATYLTKEARFIKLDDVVRNDYKPVYAGPGDRVSVDILRNENMKIFKDNSSVTVKPDETIVFMSMPVLAGNERTCQFSLDSDGPIQMADLSSFDKGFLWLPGKPPELKDWMDILNNGKLADKRDNIPTQVDRKLNPGERFIYGRVSGVSTGSTWNATITNQMDKFIVPSPINEKGRAYVLNTMHNNTLGTNQLQTAIMENRYSDTAYYSNGNYGVTYNINIPLYNDSNKTKKVRISFDTPIRLPENKPQTDLSYYVNSSNRVFFRGELRFEYDSYFGYRKEKFFHLVQTSGQKGQDLLEITLDPQETNNVNVSYVYAADSTAPHVLTLAFDQ